MITPDGYSVTKKYEIFYIIECRFISLSLWHSKLRGRLADTVVVKDEEGYARQFMSEAEVQEWFGTHVLQAPALTSMI